MGVCSTLVWWWFSISPSDWLVKVLFSLKVRLLFIFKSLFLLQMSFFDFFFGLFCMHCLVWRIGSGMQFVFLIKWSKNFFVILLDMVDTLLPTCLNEDFWKNFFSIYQDFFKRWKSRWIGFVEPLIFAWIFKCDLLSWSDIEHFQDVVCSFFVGVA